MHCSSSHQSFTNKWCSIPGGSSFFRRPFYSPKPNVVHLSVAIGFSIHLYQTIISSWRTSFADKWDQKLRTYWWKTHWYLTYSCHLIFQHESWYRSINQSKKTMMFCAWFSLHHFDVSLIQLLGLSLRPSRRIGKAIGTIIGWTWDFAGKFHQNRRPTNLTHIFPLTFQVPSGFFCCCKLWEWQNSQVTRKNPNIPKI